MKVEGLTPDREQYLIRNSKWYGRTFKTKAQCPEGWNNTGTIIPPNMRAPFYYIWLQEGGSRDFAQLLNRCARECPPVQVGGLLRTYGREGESYQEAFDACFCEEIFEPLVTSEPDRDGWLSVTEDTVFILGVEYEVTWWSTIQQIGKDGFCRSRRFLGADNKEYFDVIDDNGINERNYVNPTFYRLVAQAPLQAINIDRYTWFLLSQSKPYDDAECEICSEFSADYRPLNIQAAIWKEWINHPGGDGRQNAGPGFTDEYGFPAFEEPIYWRYREVEPMFPFEAYPPEMQVADSLPDRGLSISLEEIAPEPWIPPSSKPSSDEDDYYVTI